MASRIPGRKLTVRGPAQFWGLARRSTLCLPPGIQPLGSLLLGLAPPGAAQIWGCIRLPQSCESPVLQACLFPSPGRQSPWPGFASPASLVGLETMTGARNCFSRGFGNRGGTSANSPCTGMWLQVEELPQRWEGGEEVTETMGSFVYSPRKLCSALLLGKLTLGAAQSVPKQQLYVIMLVAG